MVELLDTGKLTLMSGEQVEAWVLDWHWNGDTSGVGYPSRRYRDMMVSGSREFGIPGIPLSR